MKRLVIWLFVLITPTALWFALTDHGHAAWRRLFMNGAGTENRAAKSLRRIPPGFDLRLPRHLVYLPVHSPPTEPALRVRLDGDANLGLSVTDPEGRHSGVALSSHKILQEIPHSQIRRTLANGSKRKHQTILVTILPAASTTYTLSLSGRRSGQYALAVNGISPSLHSVTQVFDNERVPADTSVRYQVNLKNIPVMEPGKPLSAHPALPAAQEFVSQTGTSVLPPSDPKSAAAAAAVDLDPCGYFFRRLKEVSQQHITRSQGKLTWFPDGSRFSGCQVVLHIASDTPPGGRALPNFYLPEGSYLYRLGWRQSGKWAADGSNSSEIGMDDRSWFCLAITQWPEEQVIKKNGRAVPNNALTVTVQCRENSLATSQR